MKGYSYSFQLYFGGMHIMKTYAVDNIRTIAVMGHLGSGKTSFMESVLFKTGAKSTKGSVEGKDTTSDYLIEEQAHQSSLSMTLIPAEYEGYKFNFLDTPGNEELLSDVYQALNVVKGAVLMIDGTKGIDISTDRILHELNERNIPTVIFINKMDKENIDFQAMITKIQDIIGYQAVPFLWPIGTADEFKGYVDLVEMKGRIHEGDKTVDAPIPDDLKDQVDELRERIEESVAETSEEMLEKHFNGEKLTEEEINTGLRQGVLAGDLKPLVFGSAKEDISICAMLEIIGKYMPAPNDLKPKAGKHPDTDEKIVRETSDDAPFSGHVFKTTVDPFIGSVSLIKAYSGTLKSGQQMLIANTGETVKVGQLFGLRGKEQLPMDTLHAGDIGAVSKLDQLHTGHTVCDPKAPIIYRKADTPSPTIYVAIHPKQKKDEDKISDVLHKLNVEDPSFTVQRNSETNQLLIAGQGMSHITYILEKMKNMFKVDVDTDEQKIVYRETIKKPAEAEGRHKKQSGGSGQFGVVNIKFKPIDPNENEFEFIETIHGGSVPKNYIPAVEKGLIETFKKGPLAGFPVIGVQANLFDGGYHPVDSNEISFKLAASLAFKNALKDAKPTILEPIMKLNIQVKDDYVGDVMGDINKRRGRVLGMNPLSGGKQEIVAEAPEAEIIRYTIDLKAMTQGSGFFAREFVRYEEVPAHLVDDIVNAYKD